MWLRLWSAPIVATTLVLVSLASPARVLADPPVNTTCWNAEQVAPDPLVRRDCF